MFPDQTLAKRIETAQAQNQMDYAKAHQILRSDSLCAALRIDSGAALFAGTESPLTQSFGLGFDGELQESTIETVEEFFFSRGSAVYLEVSNLTTMSLTTILGERAYSVCEYSHVLGLDMRTYNATSLALPVKQLDITEIPTAATTIAAGFLEQNIGEGEIPPDFQEMFIASMNTQGSTAFAVIIDGEVAGAGGMTLVDGIAMLSGASTQPKFRNRGVQKALITERLRFAREAGCDIAVVSTQPGTVSQRNMQAMGFEILYARTKFCKVAPTS
jgi:GNAT superfamily N-acetyltransferase